MNVETVESNLVLGLEACVRSPPESLRDRFALLMNRASVDCHLEFSCDVLGKAFPKRLQSIFTPQHGLWGDAQANMIETPDGFHARLGVPIYSLYSETRRPTAKMLDGVDCLVIDLQDAGTRVYTFIWTMLECMKACAESNINVIVLDRPNPIGGVVVEGPTLEPDFQSFVGESTIPMRHGLTIGELAKLFRSEMQIDVDLDVVPMQEWSPAQFPDDLNRHWIAPSPNLPTLASAIVYPGQVLLEGTNLSEGRGTTQPFEMVGAPFIDPETLTSRMSERRLPGVRFLPTYFRPTFDKWANQVCGGVTMHVTEPERFRSFRVTIEILAVIRDLWPDEFRWLDPPYEYETVKPPIDIIYGGDSLRIGKRAIDELAWLDADDWRERVDDALIYPRPDDRFLQ